ncbi:MAG TPA: molybdopterin cofactor-binding domain-containing protein, partial [Thermoanaerobaculia bacterium]
MGRPEPSRPAARADGDLRVVGRPLPKVDAVAKVTGRTRFADDLFLPRMLHCKLLRSTSPHAEIRAIDVSRAESMTGVAAVLVGRDLPIPYGILPVSQDEHALCLDKVRFIGDPVAAVAAVDEETAEAACREIEVEYADLDAVSSIEDALDAEDPRIHLYGDGHNVHKAVALEFGDVDAAIAEADLVLEDTFFYEGNTHLPMEQHASLAEWRPDGKLTLWSSTQTPHYVHRALARVLEIPAGRIRVIATPNGGGFGGKSDPFNHEIVVAELSRRTGRPVKICLTREEVFYCHRGRHPVLMWVRTGFRKDGSITGMHFRSYLDGGAYGSYGVASTYYTGALQTVTYPIPAYRFEGLRAFTNKPPCGPKRGHGTPQPRFALEAHLDKAAERLGLDPAEMRLANLLDAGTVTANYIKVGSMGLGACIEKVVAASGFKERRGKLPPGRGLGLACGSYLSGAGLPIYWNAMPHSGVTVQVDRGGGVAAFCGETEIGQGSDTVLAMCVAEVLGVGLQDVRIHV